MRIESEDKSRTLQVIMKYFHGFMALVYFSLGIAVIWKSEFLFNIPASYSIPLGAILIAYGIVRGWRAYQQSK